MSACPRWFVHAVAVALVFFLAVEKGQTKEASRVRILMVFEMSGNAQERQRRTANRVKLESAVKTAFRKQGLSRRYTLTILAKRGITRNYVLNYYRKLKTGPSESLVFYCNCHGITHPKYGHYMELGGQLLLRSQLRAAMLGKRPRLAVILTDSCAHLPGPERSYTRSPLRPRKSARVKPGAGALRDLFFRQTGVVDINSARRGFRAWGDVEKGNVFTLALADLLKKPASCFKSKGKKSVDWRAFYTALYRETSQKAGEGGLLQPPQAFSLGRSTSKSSSRVR